MISPESLKEIADKSQTSLLNISRDYVQTLFLYAFYQQKESSAFLFKGGTALHLIYQSPRFSEDLDFSATAFDCRIFEKLVTQALAFIEKNNLKVDLIESKPTTGGCLAIFSVMVGNLSVRIQVEVSLRTPKKVRGEAVLVRTGFLPPFEAVILEGEKMVVDKVRALLTRKKPRDFYDLYFILRTDLKFKIPKEKRAALEKEIESLNKVEVVKDLKGFLPKSHRLIIKDLPTVLKREFKKG